ncbi:hypothetical protein IE81DRAFT_350611 [Ceraceosorus guamensis]|uniref:Uncharacterized protein n=1 Tax=Ceraceosorus guamensis TaxID=1522189 RepID=A0A316VPF1_9BASI|nr:hypothetical protein IE81DRAFT_350611 [Ceraceosorus guamensis]PWN38948.1 hypothetical protein IE81DRAFT_350611 [Ceraceosorus guamensis]
MEVWEMVAVGVKPMEGNDLESSALLLVQATPQLVLVLDQAKAGNHPALQGIPLEQGYWICEPEKIGWHLLHDNGLLLAIQMETLGSQDAAFANDCCRRVVATSIQSRKEIEHHGTRVFHGNAVGIGYRKEKAGNVGLYRNWRKKMSVEEQDEQVVREDALLDYTAGLLAGVMPGLHKEHVKSARDAGLPLYRYRGYAVQGAACAGYVSGHHTDPQDPDFTVGIDLTMDKDWGKLPPGAHNFAIAPFGLVMRNGPGVFMVWRGGVPHGTTVPGDFSQFEKVTELAHTFGCAMYMKPPALSRGFKQSKALKTLSKDSNLPNTFDVNHPLPWFPES